MNILLSLKYAPNEGNNIKFVGEVNKFLELNLPKHSVSGKQSIHLIFNMGVVIWSFMQIKCIIIVW